MHNIQHFELVGKKQKDLTFCISGSSSPSSLVFTTKLTL